MFSKIFGVIWKIVLVIVSCYIAVAILIYFIKPRKVETNSNKDNYALKLARLTARPVMDLGFDQRISQIWDWEDFKIDAYRQKEDDNLLLKLDNSNEKQYSSFLQINWWDFGNTNQSVILQPENTSLNNKWMLIRCVEQANVLYCQKNNILIKDFVKTSLFKSTHIYLGVDTQGNYIKLKNIQTIDNNQRKDILYI